MPYRPKTEFKTLAEEIKSSGQPKKLTVKKLLFYFFQERRSKRVNRWIRKNLSELGLECHPDFENIYMDAEIELRKSVTVKAKKQNKLSEINTEKDPVPRVGLLPAANRAPIIIGRDAELKRAITLMLMHDFSQLPVTQNNRHIDGIVSWRSIINAQIASGQVDIVRDCLDKKVNEVSYDAPLFDAVKTVMEHEFVLVRGSDNTITGLVTITDIGAQFIALAEPFLILEQIENHIRAWLDGCFTVEQIQATLDPSDASREVEAISDLTFGEYIRLLEHPDHWESLKLPLDRTTFTRRLDDVRQIRNDVMHFHPDGISNTDLETLRETSRFFYRISQFRK